MYDFYLTRLHELTIILYALSVLLYFLDFLQHNQKANRTAFWLLSFVWILQTAFFTLYMVDTGRFPILSITEGLYLYTWVLVSMSLFINRVLKVDFIVFFTNVIGFIMMIIHTFAPLNIQSRNVTEQVVSELLFIHITVAIFSYGAFSISFVFSLLYHIQYNLLKKRKWNKRLFRIADLTRLDSLSYVLNAIGVPLLMIGIILGIQWGSIQGTVLPWYDSKIVGSFIVLIVYSFWLYLRVGKGLYGKKLAQLNIACFLIVLINFFLIGNFSTFHFH